MQEVQLGPAKVARTTACSSEPRCCRECRLERGCVVQTTCEECGLCRGYETDRRPLPGFATVADKANTEGGSE
jgi:hypothetical protein